MGKSITKKVEETPVEKNLGGRPRIYDRDEEFKALNDWSKKESSMNLLEFTTERDYPAENLSVWAHEEIRFSKALKTVKQRIALKRERLVSEGKLYAGAFQRYASSYDSTLRSHERKEKEYEAKLKKEDGTATVNLSDLKELFKDGKLKQE